MQLQVISSEEQYEEALAELDRLILANPPAGTPDADRLAVLSVLVEKYERELFPISKPSPVEAIRFRMEQQGLTPRDLEPFIGSRSKVSEVLAEKIPLSLRMIRALHEGLGIPADVLVKPVAAEESEDEPQWDKFPVRDMRKRGWIQATDQEVRTNPGALARAFFAQGPTMPASIPLFRRAVHERSGARSDAYGLLAWTARVRQRAEQERDVGDYEHHKLGDDFFRMIARLSARADGPLLAKASLAQLGIVVVIEPHLPRTKLDGASMLSWSGRPIIGLTLRYDRIDNFWFTLLHELEHVQRHLRPTGTPDTFIDDLDIDVGQDELEVEADRLAGEALIPRSVWRRSAAFRERTQESVLALAAELGIHPAIVAGRLQRETKKFHQFSQLLGHRQIRHLFGLVGTESNDGH